MRWLISPNACERNKKTLDCNASFLAILAQELEIIKFGRTTVTADGHVSGEHKPTGIRPLFTPRLETAGFKLGVEMFSPRLVATKAPRQNR